MRVSFSILFVLLLSVPLWAAEKKSNKAMSFATYKQTESSVDFRRKRRMGFGLVAAGSYGVTGFQIEMNFTPEYALLAGVGGGPSYQSFSFQAKRSLGEGALVPYIAMGFARWASIGDGKEPIRKTVPSYLGEKLLTEEQKQQGRFQKNLLFPSLGAQYDFLQGGFAGTAIFAELVVLMDLNEFLIAPTGALGLSYYF